MDTTPGDTAMAELEKVKDQLPIDLDEARSWPHMDKIEPEKLLWMTELPAPKVEHGQTGFTARFDFEGGYRGGYDTCEGSVCDSPFWVIMIRLILELPNSLDKSKLKVLSAQPTNALFRGARVLFRFDPFPRHHRGVWVGLSQRDVKLHPCYSSVYLLFSPTSLHL